MNQYIEITLLPNSEMSCFSLWSKVFQQLHLAFVKIKDSKNQVSIGVSFPEYVVGEKCSVLGGQCRLFASDQAILEQLDIAGCLVRLTDYVHYTSISPVPDKVKGYACFQRYQPKTNPSRLARRYARRHGIDFDMAFSAPIHLNPFIDGKQTTSFRYCDLPSRQVALPFIRLTSLSSGQDFCLWIKKVADLPVQSGLFSTYGLSVSSTVPEF